MIALALDGEIFPVREQLGTYTRHLVARDRDGHEIGHVSWNEYTAEIWDIHVYHHRRRGIATMLYLLARDIEPRIHHSARRTDDGEGWARSLGETLPERLAA